MVKLHRATAALSILVSLAVAVVSLSPDATSLSSQNKPIERVAIIGAGIAGLSLAHALTNSPTLANGFQGSMGVSIYDSRESLNYKLGAGMQLNGGLAVLGKINPAVQQAVRDTGIGVSQIRGRHKSWFQEDATDRMWDIDVKEAVRKAGGKAEDELIEDGELVWCSVTRGALQETLRNTLPSTGSSTVAFNKMLTGIKAHEGGGCICEFSDGSNEGPFDLVVGCDGIKSAVKEYVETGKISKDASKRENTGIYSGVRIRYAMQDGDDLNSKDSSSSNEQESTDFKQVFADGAYAFCASFGNGPDRPNSKGVYITFLDEAYNGPFKRDTPTTEKGSFSENADWSQDQRKPVAEAREQMLAQVKRFNFPNEDIGPIIGNADRFFELGVYFHNPLTFAGWSKEINGSAGAFAVLCGDSAHAMPPFLGQGGNQAIQDAYCLAAKVYQYNAQVEGRWTPQSEKEQPKKLKSLIREYERTRWIPTTSITAKAAVLGYLETGGRSGFYAKFRDIFFKTLSAVGVPTKVLVGAATPQI